MTIAHLVGFIADIVWLFIPIRQLRTNYFLFFLVNAITAAIIFIDQLLLIHPANFYLGQGIFLILSLYKLERKPSHILIIAVAFVISVSLPFFLSIHTITLILILEHMIIFTIILKKVVIYINQYLKLNFFHFLLLLLEITMATRFYVVIENIRTGIIFFYISSAFGIIIGIFFLFYNEKNSPAFSLKK
jgi:hypothetical protein